ncbi:MAG: EAL domain-containing protein [Bryobacteraceae bacterium]
MTDPIKLLVVDDEPHNREILARRLERAGYAVEAAPGGQEALEWLDRHAADMVLLDYMMPGMNGFELLKLLRGTYSPAELPVIIVTAINDSDSVVEALELGANDFIAKPIDFPVALARIQSHLRQGSGRQKRKRDKAEHGQWDWDLGARRGTLCEDAWNRLGYDVDHARPAAWPDLLHPADRTGFDRLIEEAILGRRGELMFESRFRHRNGSFRWLLSRGMVEHDDRGGPARAWATLIDITDAKNADPVTGLANRLHMADMVARRLAEVPELGPFAVLTLNLERFRLLDHTLGDRAAELLLREIARRISTGVRGSGGGRPEDKVARLDSDRFGILLAQVDCEEKALSVARRVQRDLQTPFDLEGTEFFSACGVGVVVAGDQYQSSEEVIRDAELALNRAHVGDGGRCAVFRPMMRSWAMERLRIETELRRALELEQFAIYYQPRIDLSNDTVAGFEALLRWNHPERGLVLPSEFIPVLEETGLILPIGKWVIRTACRDLRQWQEAFPASWLEVSVNVSVNQLRAELREEVRIALEETGLDPACLQLEITESVLMSDVEGARAIFEGVKRMGVGLKIDDFGTGYSSLSYLARLPFDWLKIDRSFTRELCETGHSLELTRTMIGLASGLGMNVVAEGIESAAQAEKLKALGCRFGQGYLFAKPMPPQGVIEYLRERT